MRQVPQPSAVDAPQGMAALRHRPDAAGSRPVREASPLSLSVPLVIVLAALAWVAWRFLGLRAWQAVVCLLLGFVLAATSAAARRHGHAPPMHKGRVRLLPNRARERTLPGLEQARAGLRAGRTVTAPAEDTSGWSCRASHPGSPRQRPGRCCAS